MVFAFQVFPSLLPIITFATHVALGNSIDFTLAITSMAMFDIIRGPICEAPNLVTDVLNNLKAMRKIQRFLDCDEVQPNIRDQWADNGTASTVIKMNGHFSWGFQSTFKDEDETEDEDKEEKETKVEEEKKEDKTLGS